MAVDRTYTATAPEASRMMDAAAAMVVADDATATAAARVPFHVCAPRRRRTSRIVRHERAARGSAAHQSSLQVGERGRGAA